MRPLLARLALPVFLFEAAVMGFLALFGPMPVITETVFDSSLLTILLFPVLYVLTFRPLMVDIEHRKQLEEALQATNEALESELAERRKAEDLAIHRERMFRSLAENLPDLIARFGHDRRVVYLSSDVGPATGLAAADLVGRTLEEMNLFGEARERLDAGVRRAFETGEVGAVEFSFSAPGGSRWYEARMVPEQGTGGGVGSVLVIARDISRRIQNEESLRRYAEEQRALYTVAAAAGTLQEADALLSTVLDAVMTVLDADAGWVTVLPGPRRRHPRVAAARGVSAAFVTAEESAPVEHCALCATLMKPGRRTTPPHPLGACTRIAAEVRDSSGLQSHAALNLHRGGERFGFLNVAWRSDRSFSAADEALLEALVDQISVALSNSALFESEQKARLTADTLRSAGMALTGELDLDTVLKTLLRALAEIVEYDRARIMLLDPSGRLVVRAAESAKNAVEIFHDSAPSFLPADHPIIAGMLRNGSPVCIPDTREHPAWPRTGSADSVGSWMGVPLIAGERTIGMYSVARTEAEAFTEDHVRLAEGLAAPAAMALQNAWLFEEVLQGRERLQVLSRDLVDVQERERRAVARELHDEAGQTLTSLMIVLGLLERDLDKPENARRHMRQITRAAEKALEGLHRLATNLRPASLDHLGLAAALEELVSELHVPEGTQVDFQAVGLEHGERLAPAVETALYRVAQAALTNAVRHSHATRIAVLVQVHDDRAVLVVEDNGVGFDLAAARSSGRLGLLGMRERVEMLGGEVTVETGANAGTTILVEVPRELPSADRG